MLNFVAGNRRKLLKFLWVQSVSYGMCSKVFKFMLKLVKLDILDVHPNYFHYCFQCFIATLSEDFDVLQKCRPTCPCFCKTRMSETHKTVHVFLCTLASKWPRLLVPLTALFRRVTSNLHVEYALAQSSLALTFTLRLGLGLKDLWPWPWPWPRQCCPRTHRCSYQLSYRLPCERKDVFITGEQFRTTFKYGHSYG